MKQFITASMILLVGTASAQVQMQGDISQCPVHGGAAAATSTPEKMEAKKDGPTNRDWWPNSLDLSILRQNSMKSDPNLIRLAYII